MKIGNIEVYGIIYKIINKVNKKVYIGQTSKKFKSRYPYKSNCNIERVYKRHLSCKNCGHPYNEHLFNSIEKYGFDNFEVYEFFDIAFSKEELNIKEQTWILYYDSYKNGYNRNLGGNGNSGYEGFKGENNPYSKVVYQYDLEGNFIKKWNCLSDASSELGISSNHIYAVSNKEYGRKSNGGYQWSYDYYEKINPVIKIRTNKSVVQLNRDGEFISRFESLTEAEKQTGCKLRSISEVCNGRKLTHNNYIWIFEENYDKSKDYSIKTKIKGVSVKIVQLDLEFSYLKTFNSYSEIINTYGYSHNKIKRSIEKSIPLDGFLFLYEKDYKCTQ